VSSTEYLPTSTEEEEAQPDRSPGWFRAMRDPSAMELLKANPLALCLAYVIATRAQYREGFNRYNLGLGEALLGDHRNYGMSAREYRTAKQQLATWHFATFKTTNKGTIGKLTDTRLFAIWRLPSDKQNDSQPTSKRQASDKQPTTTKNIRTERANKNSKRFVVPPVVNGIPT